MRPNFLPLRSMHLIKSNPREKMKTLLPLHSVDGQDGSRTLFI
jgi:hypothetical protein